MADKRSSRDNLIPSMHEESAETIDNFVMPIPVEMTPTEETLTQQ